MHKLYLSLTFVILSFSVFAQIPADEDFSDDTPGIAGEMVTNDGVVYFEDGALADGYFIELYEASSYGLNFPPGSNALVYNAGQVYGNTHYGFRSENGAEFRLASIVIDVAGSVNGFATQYIIRGYRNGVEQVAETVDFETAATYGSISYTKNLVYNSGGTLTFSSSAGWKNIDEIRFYWNNNLGMLGAVKSIDFEPAITGTLPVSLLDYSASLQANNQVKVQWSTADETDNSHFHIERAVNSGEFSVIGRVEGRGTQTNRADYSFVDKAPVAGTNYYRLVQYDLNGRHKTYKILTVRIQLDGLLSIYPNPVSGNGFTVTLSKLTAPIPYTLSSLSGKVIGRGTITSQQQFIPISSALPKGTYLLTTSNGATMKVLCR